DRFPVHPAHDGSSPRLSPASSGGPHRDLLLSFGPAVVSQSRSASTSGGIDEDQDRTRTRIGHSLYVPRRTRPPRSAADDGRAEGHDGQDGQGGHARSATRDAREDGG